MDRIDRKILRALQADGRQSLTDLAEQVNLSLSACHRRVRALELSGVIRGYRAELSAEHLGLNFAAVVFATLKDGDHAAVSAFETALLKVPEVIEAQRLFGDPDYLLRVVAKDLKGFQELYDQQLSSLPNVQRLTSTLVMKSVIESRALPL